MTRSASPVACLLAVLGAVACGAAPRAPQHASAELSAAPDAASGDEGSDDEATDDSDGDAEAEDIAPETASDQGPCPRNMALVDGRFCIDRYEAALVETADDGSERPFPHYQPVDGHAVRAISEPGVFPQGYISELQAEEACAASGKRLCTHAEWKTACMGTQQTTFPYGAERRAGACHDTGKSAVVAVFGAAAVARSEVPEAAIKAGVTGSPRAKSSRPSKPTTERSARASTKATKKKGDRPAVVRTAHVVKGRAAESSRPRVARTNGRDAAKASKTASKKKKDARGKRPVKVSRSSTRPASVEPSVWTRLNDPALGQVEGALARTGEHPDCVNDYGVFDMVGNIHEWVATDPNAPHGTFAGGYYLDTSINGDGCNYRTVAHAHDYHDYSTGFRCCAAAKPQDD